VVMMAAMMFPSVSPTVLIYNRLRAVHTRRYPATNRIVASAGSSSFATRTQDSWPGTKPGAT
jgi:predicted metal-binding membrane protein